MHAMQDPYKPKVGERARLKWSPDKRDSHLLGREFVVSAVNPAVSEFAIHYECEPGSEWIHRDAVWEPVAAQEPTAEPAQPEASDPIETLREAIADIAARVGFSGAYSPEPVRAAREALATLERDRAAHAAEVGELRNQVAVGDNSLRHMAPAYEAAKGQVTVLTAEVERLRGELAEAKTKADRLEALWITDARHLKAELAKARAELEKRSDEAALRLEGNDPSPGKTIRDALLLIDRKASTVHDASVILAFYAVAQLEKTRAKRPEPTDEELANIITTEYYSNEPSPSLRAARAAKAALLGVRREVVAPTFEEVYGALKGTARRALSDQTRAVFALFNAEPKGQPEAAKDDEGFDVIKVLRKLADDHEARVYALERATEHLGEKR